VAAFAVATRTLLPPSHKLSLHVVDVADWSRCLAQLQDALCTPPALSAYASERAKEANEALVAGDSFDASFVQHDILSVSAADLGVMMRDAFLCTVMFTLNELFSTSMAKTTTFLLALTECMAPGAWLLIVDSPGSYSEVKLGNRDESKRYPMKWLLDHTLLNLAGDEDNRKWRKTVSDDSRWFRPNQQALKYPLELESMRYQIHLYQRVAP
jgi:25S rRNA (uracil2843-N3)-methyltransferase